MLFSFNKPEFIGLPKGELIIVAALGFVIAFAFIPGFNPNLAQGAENETSGTKDGSLESFEPDPDRAIVYIYRPTKLGASGVRKKVYINGQYQGRISTGRYRVFHLDPGAYIFGVLEKKDKRSLDMDLKAGEIHYIRLRIKMGIVKARGKFEIVDEAEGQKKIRKLNLSKPFDPDAEEEDDDDK